MATTENLGVLIAKCNILANANRNIQKFRKILYNKASSTKYEYAQFTVQQDNNYVEKWIRKWNIDDIERLTNLGAETWHWEDRMQLTRY